MDQLEQKRQKRVQFGFTQYSLDGFQPCRTPRVHIPVAEIFKEVSKYFGILPRAFPFFSLRPANISFLIFLDILHYFLKRFWREKTCTLVKEEECLHSLEKISKSCLLFIIDSNMFSSSVISMFSLSMAE